MNFKLLFDRSPICITKVDLDQRILYANPAWSVFSGYSLDELLTKKYTEITHPEDIKKDVSLFELLLKGDISEYRLKKRYVHKTGKIIWGDLFVSLLPDENGRSSYSILSSVIDITEKVEKEEAINHAEEVIRMGSWEWDLLSSDAKWSDNTYRIFEVDPKDIVLSYDYFLSRVHPDDQPIIVRAYQQLLSNKNKLVIKYRILLSGERILWIQDSIQACYMNNKLVKLKGVIVDVTEQKASEKALLKNRDALRHAQVVAKMGSWEYDPVHNDCSWSKNMYQLLKINAEDTELSFDFLKGLVHPDDQHIAFDHQKWCGAKRETFSEEFRCVLPNNEIIWIESHAVPVFEKDKMTALRGVCIDITERKKKERELLRFSKILKQSPVSVVITDIKGNIEYVNPEFTEVTGYEEHEVIGKKPNVLKSYQTDNLVYADIWDTITSGDVWKGELINRHKLGAYYWEHKTISPVVDKMGRIINYVSFGEDITSSKKIEQELIAAKEKAEESVKLKTAFTQNISHEIRTPMNAILGFMQLLQEPDLEMEERKEFVNIVNQSGQRLMSTLNDIMEISKIESGVKEVHISEVNIEELMRDSFNLFKTQAKAKGLSLKWIQKSNAILRTDKTKLEGILANLINNAFKFTDAGSVEMGSYIEGKEVVFFVKDTGIGIPANSVSLIFERFVQVDLKTTRTHEGAGLGLAIAKAYVDALKGKIWVDSEEGRGSAFYFSLPHYS